MNLTTGIEWLTTTFRRQWTSDAGEPDFGDMGTAFGLDMSLSGPSLDGAAGDSRPRMSEAAYAAGLAMR